MHQVLARKWRPKTFSELIGQEHVLKALINALTQQRLHHAYLFTGTRGVGKTTIARILARALNCETGITPEPCGSCSACQEINEGRFIDLIEVDAASRTKVEDTRDLLENTQYRPTRGRFKIYLIDEVHMLSNHSFNALLKTLEEPPEHVKFLLATTDPQKLPVTVLSRCLQFHLKNLTASRIQDYLADLMGQESISYEQTALWHLARAAQGSMRDALSLTDQAIAQGGGSLSEQEVTTMLGTVDQQRIYALLDAIEQGSAQELLNVTALMVEHSPNYSLLTQELIALVHRVALQQAVNDLDRADGFLREKIEQYAAHFPEEELQVMYQILIQGQRDLNLTPDPSIAFEMLMLRLLAFQVASMPKAQVKAPARQPEKQISDTSTNVRQEREEPPAKKPEAEAVEPRLDEKNKAPSSQTSAQLSASETPEQPLPDQKQESQASPSKAAACSPVEHEVDTAVLGPSTVSHPGKEAVPNQGKAVPGLEPVPRQISAVQPRHWLSIFDELAMDGMLLTVASHLALQSVTDNRFHFVLAKNEQSIFEPSHRAKLAARLSEYFQITVDVMVEESNETIETPASYAQQCYEQALNRANQELLDVELARGLVSEFNASLIPDTVQLVDHRDPQTLTGLAKLSANRYAKSD